MAKLDFHFEQQSFWVNMTVMRSGLGSMAVVIEIVINNQFRLQLQFQNLSEQMGSKGGEGVRRSSLPVSPLLINAIDLEDANRRQ